MRHDLTGCPQVPLAEYLKAIAVLRLLAEQADTGVAGFWEESHFVLLTELDRDQLLDFFCETYSPTPIVNPWTGGSGFYPGDNKMALNAIIKSTEKRFSPYREVIAQVSAWNDVKFTKDYRGKNKQQFLIKSRNTLPDIVLNWLDAAYVLKENGQAFTPALGTGGNEGRLEMSNNFMKQVAGLFLKGSLPVRSLLESSLFGTLSEGLIKSSIGQMNPGRSGGYNQGMGIEKKDFKINPWDYVLMMEGSIVLAGSAVRRYPTPDRMGATSPFTVRYSDVGFSSSSPNEKGLYETWLPVWKKPVSWVELKHLFGEGRSTIGRRVTRTGLDFSRSLGLLGTDRGLSSFQRNIFLKRRGDSYIALPAGSIKVRYEPRIEIINELDPVIRQIETFLRGFKNVPASYEKAYRSVREAMFKTCEDATTDNFIRLMRALGRLDHSLATRSRSLEPNLQRPLYGLSPRWLSVCDDGSVEVRIAGSLSSIHETGAVGNMRSIMAGTKPHNPNAWDNSRSGYWHGNSLSERLGGVLLRRFLEAEQGRETTVPLEAYLRLSSQDVMPFLYGETDDSKIEELLWAFLMIDWRKRGYRKAMADWKKPVSETPISRSFCLLKLLYSPVPVRNVKIRMEPRVAKLLHAGRIPDALSAAYRRLLVSGLEVFDVSFSDYGLDPDRLLASLLLPVHDMNRLEALVMKKGNDRT